MDKTSNKRQRTELIQEILTDLKDLRRQGYENKYAVEANIKYFKSLSSFWSYLKWLIFDMPKLDSEKLLELSDFHLRNGKWERILQRELLEIEQWNFPDLLKPLRSEILETLGKTINVTRPILLVNLGAGAMEIDRQVIKSLQEQQNLQKIVFVGIDNSQESLEVARTNFSTLNIHVKQLEEINPNVIANLLASANNETYQVFSCKADIANLKKMFAEKSIDLLYFSKFKHHLHKNLKQQLDEIVEYVAWDAIEFDNRNGWFMKFVPIKANWHQPVLLNGGVFSCLRTPTKQALLANPRHNWKVKIFIDGYLRKYTSPKATLEKIGITEAHQNIIEAALQAPSGDNCQPWQFKIKNNEIFLYNIPTRDTSLYNHNQHASYIAHGAVLENIKIAATNNKYQTTIELFPDSNQPNLVSIIKLEESQEAGRDSLYPHIFKRCTNRKPYQTVSLSNDQLTELINTTNEVGGLATMMLTQVPENIHTLSSIASRNEQILFENFYMHQFFFNHINWTSGENTRKKIGFYIETLELPPPAKIMMKLFRNWGIMKIFNKLKIGKSVATQNARVYATASIFGIIVIEKEDRMGFVHAGRLLERVWLKVTRMGLSMQPLTGIVLLGQGLNGNTKFDQVHMELIRDGYEKIKEIFGISKGVIPVMFRIGQGGNPTARSIRFSVNESLKN